MRILITGGDGMVARALTRHCALIGDDVRAYSRTGLDITSKDVVAKRIKQDGPDAVINCAAFTDVDGAESEPEVCRAVNADGVRNLAGAALESDSVFVTISTDYVFDGEKKGFYTQADPPRPRGVYAEAKLEGERLAAEANPASIIVRSGWIFGEYGKNFLSVLPDLLAGGKPVSAIDDAFGTPTFAADLAVRLRELAESGRAGIYHIVNSGPGTSYFGFAEAICAIGGFDPDLLLAVSESELDRPAPRPKNSRLACLKSKELGFVPMPDWEDALRRFVPQRVQ